jgi:hypothetical protein
LEERTRAVARRWVEERAAYSEWAIRLDLALLAAIADWAPPPLMPSPVPVAEPARPAAPEPAPAPAPVSPASPVAKPSPKVDFEKPLEVATPPAANRMLLVVEPVTRFRALRDIELVLQRVPGLLEARLEQLDGGTATYRLTFGDAVPSDEQVAAVLAPLGLRAALVSISGVRLRS